MGLARVNGHAEEVERLIVTSCVNCQIHVNKNTKQTCGYILI